MDSEQLMSRLVELARGSAEGGGVLPSEPRLAEVTGASRNSVREALIRLEERGYVHRSQGTRTALNLRLADVGLRIDRQCDHAASIAAAGYEPLVTVLVTEIVDLRPDRARFDDLGDGERVLRTVKVWSADGVPYVMAEDLVPVRTLDAHAGEVDSTRPVFDLAEELNSIDVAWETVWFAPVLLAAAEAQALGVDLPAAGLELVYCGVGAADDVAYWCREIQVAAPERLRNALVRRVNRS